MRQILIFLLIREGGGMINERFNYPHFLAVRLKSQAT